jgi:hypothetical protein
LQQKQLTFLEKYEFAPAYQLQIIAFSNSRTDLFFRQGRMIDEIAAVWDLREGIIKSH